MARIRTIKPEFWDSPATARASLRARLFFIAMWNWADDYGVGSANHRQLLGFAFPNDDDITVKDLPSLCKEVADCYGIVFFEYKQRPFFVIPSWNEHQRTERRAKRDEGLHEAAQAAILAHNHAEVESVEEMRGSSDASQGDSGAGTGEREPGNRGKGTGEQGNLLLTESVSLDVSRASKIDRPEEKSSAHVDPQRVIDLVETMCDFSLTEHQANELTEWVIGRASEPVRHPLAYTERAIKNDPQKILEWVELEMTK